MTAPLTALGVERVAQALTISNRHTSTRTRWDVWDEQRTMWRLMETYPRILAAKARKVGISTACELWDVLWTWLQDTEGNRVRTVIAIDTDAKAIEHAAQIQDFARQLKIRLKSSNAHGVEFPNGSKIDCITAGGEDPGRGGTIHRLHITELPFWRQPQRNYQALRSSCSDNAQVVIETTMDLQNDAEWIMKLWDGAVAGDNEFHAHFWKVQDHASYRSDVEITDEEWQICKREGFTDRRAGAYWLKEALQKCAGSMLMLMHDFPQKEAHLFAAGLGRVILADPPAAVVDGYLEVNGLRGDTWNVEVYGEKVYAMNGAEYVYDENGNPVVERIEQIPDSGQVVITVDTAQGVKKTNSIVLAVDKKDRRPLACFWDNTILHDDLARVAQTVREFFSRKRAATLQHVFFDSVTVVIEDDGIGGATCTEAMNIGLPHERWHQGNVGPDGNSLSAACITAAKTHLEAKPVPSPAILRSECRELVRDEKQQLKGRKDCVMMYGLANLIIDRSPYVPPRDKGAEKERRARVSFQDSLKDYEASADGGTVRPKWGT